MTLFLHIMNDVTELHTAINLNMPLSHNYSITQTH